MSKCGHYLTTHVRHGKVYQTLRCNLCGDTVYGCNGGHGVQEAGQTCQRCEDIFGQDPDPEP